MPRWLKFELKRSIVYPIHYALSKLSYRILYLISELTVFSLGKNIVLLLKKIQVSKYVVLVVCAIWETCITEANIFAVITHNASYPH